MDQKTYKEIELIMKYLTRAILSIFILSFFVSCSTFKPSEEEIKQTELNAAQKMYIIGRELLNEGKLEQAESRLEQALRVSVEQDYKQGQVLCLESLAYININQEKIEKGLDYISRAIELSKESQDNIQIASLLTLQGTAYASIDDFESALKTYKESLKFDILSGNILGTAVTQNNIGKLYYKMKRNDAALRNYMNALDIFIKLGDYERAKVVVQNMRYVIPESAIEIEDDFGKKPAKTKSSKKKTNKKNKSNSKSPTKKK